jgi:hypothetical protein
VYEQDSVDYKKAKKRMQNRESAIRSRMKKKVYYDNIEEQMTQVQQENNKLKLDNAALRAENQLLNRQLRYFEKIFAQKNQPGPLSAGFTPISSISSKPSSRTGGLSDDEIYNNKQHSTYIKKRSTVVSDDLFS